jgi:hypothetical protein
MRVKMIRWNDNAARIENYEYTFGKPSREEGTLDV